MLEPIDKSAATDRLGKRVLAAEKKGERTRRSKIRFTTLLYNVRDKFGLNNDEFVVADTIEKLSGNHSPIPGWCIASKATLAESAAVRSRTTIHKIIDKLMSEGLIERNEYNPSYLRTTKTWDEEVQLTKNKAFNP